ncbi:putative alternative oxidase, mitochondrial [[Candida] jaroonii]|uniref:Alternative oxidase, mitochondrial n=1 Tax=[Candida] jaroonii TaxID=467808 RepID=A0ACA9Y5M4_9ASCO|nr:putative alternative oxidase, mitochondrial [[Candida] jaroonii]
MIKKNLGIATKLVSKPQYDQSFITHPLFQHPSFKTNELKAIEFNHRPTVTVGDKIANGSVQFFRSCFDFATGYKHPGKYGYNEKSIMTENKWLTRCIFLESVAGIPGMTAAFLRHLHSLRLLKRDKAWVETLLDEAYNERIHLLTFINLGKPSWFTRMFIFLGQGVFCNLFFFNYLFFPKFCHRFVGYLEEEAVSTYTHFLKELDEGHLPKFNNMKVPSIAIHYYDNLHENSTIKDLILNIRADEAKHREVNHTFANLHQKTDRNPYALTLADEQPTNDLKYHKPEGWEREDIIMKSEPQEGNVKTSEKANEKVY